MAKIAKPKRGHEGYWMRKLGFRAKCATCATYAPVATFTYPTATFTLADGTIDHEFPFNTEAVCTFDCFKKTAEYDGPKDQDAKTH